MRCAPSYHEAMAYPEKLLSDGESVIREFRPHWQAIAAPIVIVVGLTLVGGVVGAVVSQVAAWLPTLIGFLVGLAIAAPRIITWAFTKHVITNERVIVRSGVVSRQGKEIPLEVINDVAFSQTVFERVTGSGDLLLESAGELGQSRFHNVPKPEMVQTMIYKAREERISELNSGRAPTDTLTALAQLHRDGVLTDEEFAAKKQQLLDEI